MMLSYYLLRENQESGPYTLRELTEKPLYSTDLVWIEGESTCWKFPAEIDALKDSVKKAEIKKKTVQKSYTASTLQTAKRENQFSVSTLHPGAALSTFNTATQTREEEVFTPSFEELKRKYAERTPKKKVWKSQINIASNLFGISTLVIGVMMGAFMVKKAIDNIEFEPLVATAEAAEIQSGQLPSSTTSHAAMTGFLPAGATTTEGVLTEITKESLPDQKETVLEEAKETPASAAKTAAFAEESSQSLTEEQGSKFLLAKNETTNGSAEEKLQEEKVSDGEEKTEKPAFKSNLQLSANNYKVGMLGGISNLELSITNSSTSTINKAIVEVEFLKPNGKVANTQTLEVSGIAPGASKKIAVPDNGRGVSVRYRLVNIEA